MTSPVRSPLTLDDVRDGLRHGDFTRLEPVFGDPARRAEATGPLIAWIEAGALDDEPALIDEALTCACWLGYTGVAARLLARGVDPAAGTATGLDALHWAANRGQRASVELLLAHGAPTETRSMYGGTALGTAVWSACNEARGDQLGAIRALLAAGADTREIEVPTGHPEVDALLRAHAAPVAPATTARQPMPREAFERTVELELPSLDHDGRAGLARWRVSPQQVHRIVRHASEERDPVWVLARAGAKVLFYDHTGDEWGTAMLDADGIMREWRTWGDRLGRALRQFPGR